MAELPLPGARRYKQQLPYLASSYHAHALWDFCCQGEPLSEYDRAYWGDDLPTDGMLEMEIQYIRRSPPMDHRLRRHVMNSLMSQMVVQQVVSQKMSLMDLMAMTLATQVRGPAHPPSPCP